MKIFLLPLCRVHSKWDICEATFKFCNFNEFCVSVTVSEIFWDFSNTILGKILNLL